jgi:hypothetical protein
MIKKKKLYWIWDNHCTLLVLILEPLLLSTIVVKALLKYKHNNKNKELLINQATLWIIITIKTSNNNKVLNLVRKSIKFNKWVQPREDHNPVNQIKNLICYLQIAAIGITTKTSNYKGLWIVQSSIWLSMINWTSIVLHL